MSTIIKIVVTVVILTACFQGARASLNNFQFEDAAQQRLLFETRATDDEVVNLVLRLASEYGIPLREENVSVNMVGQDRIVRMSYTLDVELVPGVFTYPWTFTPRTSTRLLNAPPR